MSVASRPVYFAAMAAFGVLLPTPTSATEWPIEHSPPTAYFGVGITNYKTAAGYHDAFAYTLGVDYPLTRFLSVDAGFADFGTANEPKVPLIAAPIVLPWGGTEVRRRASFAMATLRWSPLPRLNVSAGVGPAVVFTRVRSYSTALINPKISVIAQDHVRTEVFAKVAVELRLTDAWSVDLAAFGTSSVGYTFNLMTGERTYDLDSVSATLGLRYSGNPSRRKRSQSVWSAEAGPAVSALSYHANYRATPIGYDLSIAYKRASGFFATFGHTEFGVVSQRPRYPDGTPLRTPPFNDFYPDGDLRVTSSATYLALGFEHSIADRLTLGVAAGPSRTVVSFLGATNILGSEGRYIDIADKVTAIGQAHVKWKLRGGWHAKLSVRYTEIQGPQITFPDFEPDFGNTKVRILSFIPAISLRF